MQIQRHHLRHHLAFFHRRSGRQVDGHDFFEVYDAAKEAVDRARAGGGPSLIHVRLNRYYGHFEGDAMTYRGDGEVDRLRGERDSLALFRKRVTETGLLGPDQLDAIEQEARTLIDESVQEAVATPSVVNGSAAGPPDRRRANDDGGRLPTSTSRSMARVMAT